jgi:hypothetical protein
MTEGATASLLRESDQPTLNATPTNTLPQERARPHCSLYSNTNPPAQRGARSRVRSGPEHTPCQTGFADFVRLAHTWHDTCCVPLAHYMLRSSLFFYFTHEPGTITIHTMTRTTRVK